MRRTESFEKTLMLGKIEDRMRRGQQRMRWLDDITNWMDRSLSNSKSLWWTRKAGMLQSMALQRAGYDWATELNWYRWKVKVLVTQSCPAVCDPMDCSPSVSSIHGILQARRLEWVAIPFSRVSCIAGRFFIIWDAREALMDYYSKIKKSEILPFATSKTDLEGIMLSKINQTQKDKYCVVSLIHGNWKIKQVNDCNKTETNSQI